MCLGKHFSLNVVLSCEVSHANFCVQERICPASTTGILSSRGRTESTGRKEKPRHGQRSAKIGVGGTSSADCACGVNDGAKGRRGTCETGGANVSKTCGLFR